MKINAAGDQFLSGYFATHERSEKTKDAYRSDILQFQKFLGEDFELSSLTGSEIERWAARLREKGYSPASIRRKIVVLKVFCSYWVRNGALSESPFWRVKLSYGRIEQLPRTLTETEIHGLLKQAQQKHSAIEDVNDGPKNKDQEYKPSSDTYRAIRNLAILELLFATGMRVGESSSIDLDDFSPAEGMFKILGKGGRERLAFIVDEVALRIQKKHLEIRNRMATESTALFLNVYGDRLSTQGIANILTQLRRESGIRRHITPHMLRHTVATLLLRNGVDIRVVQEFLGHASIATTQRYTHITKEHMVKELKSRHPSLNLR
jgi:integrase/recombinase XerD